jgi:hypothetical protein
LTHNPSFSAKNVVVFPMIEKYDPILTKVRGENRKYTLHRLENLRKRGREVPGPSKEVLGLLDFFSPGTKRSWDLKGL